MGNKATVIDPKDPYAEDCLDCACNVGRTTMSYWISMRRTSARKLVSMSFVILAMGLSALGVIACGQGGEPGGSQTQAAEFRLFNSSIKGYSIEYPADWSVKTEQPVEGTSDDLTVDKFKSADQKVTVSVECVSLARVNTIDDFLQNELGVLTVGGFSDVKVERNGLIVAGTPAPVLDYTLRVEDSTQYFTTVLAFKDCGWWITLYTSTSDGRAYKDLFEHMATSFTTG